MRGAGAVVAAAVHVASAAGRIPAAVHVAAAAVAPAAVHIAATRAGRRVVARALPPRAAVAVASAISLVVSARPRTDAACPLLKAAHCGQIRGQGIAGKGQRLRDATARDGAHAVHRGAIRRDAIASRGGQPVDVKPFDGAQTLDLAELGTDALADELRCHGLERRGVRCKQQEAETGKQVLRPAPRGRGNHPPMRRPYVL